MTEAPDIRRKRLVMRAGHRGTKEMDIIFTRWTNLRLADADDETLDNFEDLLEENDQDLYQWVTGQSLPPVKFKAIVTDLQKIVGTHKELDPN